jgi:hypothetical protein
MPAVPADLVIPLAAIALGLVLGAALWGVVQARLRRWRTIARLVRARRGEARAHELLESRGFSVLGAQCAGSYRVSVDGTPLDVDLRADYLVEKNGLRYIAEVKTGNLAPLVRTPSTRRQLLEYRLAFDVDGVLLVDIEAARIQAVTFPLLNARSPDDASHVGWVVIGALLLVVIVVAQSMSR